MTARTVPPIPTFAYKEGVTSGKLNEYGTYLAWWSNRPMFRMFQSATQNVPASTWTQITMDTATGTAGWDTDSGRAATSPWSYVIPAGLAGRWSFRWKVAFASNATGVRYCTLMQNGVEPQGSKFNIDASSSTVEDMPTGMMTLLCAVGDTIGVWGYQNSGATLATDATTAPAASFFEGSFESFANP